MAIPKWLDGPSPQEKGRRYERKVAKRLGTKPQIASGALPFNKEDIELENFLIQVKHTTKKSYTIKLDDLNTLIKNATKVGKIPVMIVNLGGKDWSLMPWDDAA